MVGTYSGFVFAMLIYYIIIPIILISNIESMSLKYSNIYTFIVQKDSQSYILSLFLTLLCFFIFTMFYNISYKRNFSIYPINIVREYNQKKAIKIYSFFARLTLIVGGGAFLFLLISMGGITSALKIAEINRSFAVSLEEFTKYPLLVIPARLITVTPFLYLLLLIEKRKSSYLLFFSISFLLAIIFFLFNAGRTHLIAFLLCFAFIYIKKYIRKSWTLIIVLGVVSLPLLDIMDQVFLFFSTHQLELTTIDYSAYLYQFIHPFRNILNLTEMVNIFGLRNGIDFVTSFIGLLPGLDFSKSYENTSLYFIGENWHILGGIPNDFITFGFIQFKTIGVILITSILGFIFGIIDKSLNKLPNGITKNLVSSALVINTFIIVSTADLEPIIKGNFILIILSISIIFTSNQKLKNKGNGII